MATFFTSDLHLEHDFLAMKRGFTKTSDMTDYVIDQYNSVVGKDDRVFILGDFGLMQNSQVHKYTKRLNGEKFLIAGNHDKIGVNHNGAHGFSWIKHYHEEVVDGVGRFILFHYPILEWHWMDRKEVYHLYGHVHGNTPARIESPYKSMDVGIDTNEFYLPYRAEDIVKTLEEKESFKYLTSFE